jgi:hypothetical protein
MRKISYEVIQKKLQLHERHGVPLLLRTMRLGMSLNLKIRQTIDEANALEIIRKKLLRPPEKVVTLLSVVGVTQRALRKSDQGINRAIPNVRKQGRLANPCNQRVEGV